MRYFKKVSKFSNPHIDKTQRNVRDFFKWYMGKYEDEKKLEQLPHNFSVLSNEEEYNTQHPNLQWINHSTFTINHDDLTFLTDPIWSKRCSPVPFFGPKRKHAPPIEIEDLGDVHFVLISHNHYDHLDKPTVLKLNTFYPDLVWIVPEGLKRWFKKLGIHNVIELKWWEESIHIKNRTKVSVTAVPAQHFSGRYILDSDRSHWAGFVVEIDKPLQRTKRFYFAGDTGYNEHDFKKIGKKFGRMDLSLIPIGAYAPRNFQSPVHVNPQEAVQIHQEVGSKLSVGCHWNTFKLSKEEQIRPPYDLSQAVQAKNLHPKEFQILLPGEILNW